MDKINKIKIKDVTYEIGGGGSSATVDSGLSSTSENAVQNKVITSELGKKIDKSGFTTTNKEAVVKYNHFGGIYEFDDRIFLHVQSQYTGSTFTSEVIDKASLCKIVGFTRSTSLVDITTGLYAIFNAEDLGELKKTFTNGKAFTAYVCNPPSDPTDKPLYDIYQDLGTGDSMLGKEYVMPLGREHSGYPSDNLLNHNHPTEITNATFASLYATYSGDTSTMFFAPWNEIRDAFVTTNHSWYINQGSRYKNIYVYSSTRVFSYSYGVGYYVKFIDKNDFTDNGVGNSIELQANVDNLWGAADLVSMKTDIASNKTKIDSLEQKVVYAEPDTASSAHTFTRTVNGEKLYTTDKNRRNISVVNSVNGNTGYVNLTATVNGDDIIGRSIDVRGDWNENYTDGTNYIYNRPFYQEDPTFGDPVYLFKGTEYMACACTNTTLQKDIAEGVLEAPFQDYTCYKEGSNYIVKKTEYISNPTDSVYCYWSGTTLTSGSSWTSIVNTVSQMEKDSYTKNNFYVRPKIDGVIHKLDPKFIQAKTINGESVLGEGEIDMSSYQTKTEAVKIARLTQAEYDALSTKDNNTLYIITDAQ